MPHTLLSVVLVVIAGTATSAADLWITADRLDPQPGEKVEIRLVEGDRPPGHPVSLAERPAERFQRIWKQGRANVVAAPGEPLGFRPAKAGVQLLAYAAEPRREGDELRRHYAKLFVVVGEAPRESSLRWSEVGHRLEIVPQSDPVALALAGGRLELQLLYDREPLAGVVIEARTVPGSPPVRGTTDEIGLVTLALPRAGVWLVRTEYVSGTERLAATLVLAAGPRAGS